jgi:hypothetical protein
MMDEDKPMNVSKAIELGFIAEEILPISAQNKQPKISDKKMSFKEKLSSAFKAFKDALDIKAMVLETADGKQLELEKESGEPIVGDVVLSEDGEYLMPDGTTIVVESSVITEIRPAEEEVVEETTEVERGKEGEENETEPKLEIDEQLSEKDAEIDRLKAEIAEKDAEIDRLRQELEDAKSNAKSTEDKNILNMVAVAGGIEWLKNVKSTGKVDKREAATSNLDKTQAKKKEQLSFAEYRKQKAERKAQMTKK